MARPAVAILPKSTIEKRKFNEQCGEVSVYTCPNCEDVIMYLYTDSGISPSALVCEHCQGAMQRNRDIVQPTRYWYRPKTITEVRKLAEGAYEKYKETFNNHYKDWKKEDIIYKIMEEYVDHYNSGGLFSKSIGEKT